MFDQQSYDNVDFAEAEILEERLFRLNFRNCKFRGADFSGLLIEDCRFEDCDFSGAEMNGMVVRRTAFLNCRFRFTNCFAAEFHSCKMTGSAFEDATCTAMQIDGGDWSFTYLADMDFHRREFNEINFTEADLSRCNFEKAVLRNCNFSGANLNGSSFRNADLRTCKLERVNILELDLFHAKIDLEQAILFAEALGAIYTP